LNIDHFPGVPFGREGRTICSRGRRTWRQEGDASLAAPRLHV